MILALGYKIYRALHSMSQHQKLSHFQFKYSVICSLIHHPVVQVGACVNASEHRLVQWEQSSAGTSSENRRKQRACQYCTNINDAQVNHQRRTTHYCSKCNLPFHPACFYLWPDHQGKVCGLFQEMCDNVLEIRETEDRRISIILALLIIVFKKYSQDHKVSSLLIVSWSTTINLRTKNNGYSTHPGASM